MFPTKITRIVVTVVACAAASTMLDGCGGGGGGGTSAPIGPPIVMPRALEGATADNTFGFKLLSQAVSTAPAGSNVILSPVSVSQMLMLAYNGANGQTASEIGNALGYGNIPLEQADLDTQNVVNSLVYADPTVQIRVANSTWLQTGNTFASTYTSNCEQYLGAQMQTLDFTNSTAAAGSINQWVDRQTQGDITSIVQPGDIAGAQFVLANAVYFHGIWSQKYFDPAKTKPSTFTLAGGSTVQASTMTGSGTMLAATDSTSQAVEIPYGSGRLFLLVIEPSQGHTVADVLSELGSSGLSPWTNKMAPYDVTLTMPKLSVGYSDPNIQNDLKTLGIVSLFNGTADLSAAGLPPGDYLRQVLFRSTLDIDETGTTATATTVGIGVSGIGGALPLTVSIDHPYVCAICDSVTGATLFTAVIQNPTASS